MAMTLGAYNFAINPNEPVSIITHERRTSSVKTLGGIEFFSWGSFLPGQEITLPWSFMPTAMYTSLLGLLTANAQVVWDPENGSTYNVEILSLNGEYHLSAGAGAAYRKNVELKLLIMSQV